MAKLKANTIVEVLVAITVIATCITLFFVIFSSTIFNQRKSEVLAAIEETTKFHAECIALKDYEDDELEFSTYRILKKVVEGENGLKNFKYLVLSNDSTEVHKSNFWVKSND